MRENNLSSLPPTWRQSPGTVALNNGGSGSSPPSSIGTPSVSAHVCKRATASPPCSRSPCTAAGAARGLALRMDQQYLSDHFTNQIKFWGIQPSYAFVAEPVQRRRRRFNRTLNEQIIHGRNRNIADAGRRPRLRRTLQCPVDRRKERLPEPRFRRGTPRDKLVSKASECPFSAKTWPSPPFPISLPTATASEPTTTSSMVTPSIARSTSCRRRCVRTRKLLQGKPGAFGTRKITAQYLLTRLPA